MSAQEKFEARGHRHEVTIHVQTDLTVFFHILLLNDRLKCFINLVLDVCYDQDFSKP